MTVACLTIDLSAIAANWRALDQLSDTNVETAAVVKADAYGLGIARVAPVLADAGARCFFVAAAEEGTALRDVIGPGPRIGVFSGYMDGDRDRVAGADLLPMLNSPEQIRRFAADFPGGACGLQLDSGMNRLGLEPEDIAAALPEISKLSPFLAMSHLACGDDVDAPENARQLQTFREMAAALPDMALSLSATAGVLLGAEYHFSMNRPGIGLYGGLPFDAAAPVVRIAIPVIQTRHVNAGEIVGYGGAFQADRDMRIATIAAGYADGLIRALGNGATLFADGVACPLAGRVSMDMLTVDVTHLDETPDMFDIIGAEQTIDDLAAAAGTIGHEILTSLGHRYNRKYIDA